MDEKVIWSHIKTLRLEYLIKHTDLKCDEAFIPTENLSNNSKKLSHMAEIKSSEQINIVFSKIDINAAAEMFMFLNSCPSFYVRLYWKAIYGPKSRIAMLASNIIKKSNDNFKPKAEKIFAKISQLLGFEHIYYDYKGNESLGQNLEFEIKTLDINVTDKKLLQTVTNHPVHILNNDGKMSPSSFIPFCSFGADFIGSKVIEFEIPVCNIFKPRINLDQLCYETDLQELKSSNNQILAEQFEMGLTLVLDYNEERQINFNSISTVAKKSLNQHAKNSVSIYLNTISIKFALMRI